MKLGGAFIRHRQDSPFSHSDIDSSTSTSTTNTIHFHIPPRAALPVRHPRREECGALPPSSPRLPRIPPAKAVPAKAAPRHGPPLPRLAVLLPRLAAFLYRLRRVVFVRSDRPRKAGES